MTGEQRVRKLKWLCRRGMKELDLLLEQFVVVQEEALRAGAWPEFESLLGFEDDALWDCVQNPGTPGAQPYRLLLDRIRLSRA